MTRIFRSSAAAAVCLAILGGLAAPASAQVQLFEVEGSDAAKLMQVDDAAGLVARGQFNVGGIPALGAGVRLMWFPGKAAFRAGGVDAGQWDDGAIGPYSMAFGFNTAAIGESSVAMNANTTAAGAFSVAMGVATVASGGGAIATGAESRAIGGNSVATGFRTQANGNASTAMGTGTVATGAASVALGSVVTAQGDGSFIFGDRSFSFPLTADPNTFMVRAFGGLGFNTGVNIGCDLPAGTGAWSCTSSRLAKEGFADVDGEAVLAKLARIRIQRWRYLGTAAEHMGPTAEDFRAAFGLGEGSTKIAAVDADGIALRAIQALERRTTELRQENAELRRRLDALETHAR